MPRALVLPILVAVGLGGAARCRAVESWPQFRGAAASGVAAVDVAPPMRWSSRENVAWSTEIPGNGWSSPVVWGNRVFVTSAISLGEFKQPSPGIYGNDYAAELQAQGHSAEEVLRLVRARDNELSDEVGEGVRWMVYALDAASGEIVWERQAHRGVPFGGRHRKNSYASETPVVDEDRLYVYFGNVGVFAYGHDGEPLWSHRFDPEPIYLDFGTASSPVLLDDTLLIQNDNQENSWLAALSTATGEEIWRVARPNDHPMIRSSFSTPFVWRNSLRTEIVVLGPAELTSYSPTGEELWRLGGTSAVAAPTPVADGDVLYVGSGSPSEDVRPLFAVRAGAAGDVSLADGETATEWVAWYQRTGGPYIPSPLLLDGRLYVLYDKGFFGAYDAATGEELYRARFGRGGHTFSSSPWVAGGRIFCLDEAGLTFVVRPGDRFEIEAENDLSEMSLASPAVALDSHFIRTAGRLYRIGAGAGESREEAP